MHKRGNRFLCNMHNIYQGGITMTLILIGIIIKMVKQLQNRETEATTDVTTTPAMMEEA